MNDDKLIAGLVLCVIGIVGGSICCFPIILLPPGVILVLWGVLGREDRQIVYVRQPGYPPSFQNNPQYQQPVYQQQRPYAPPPQPHQYEEPPPPDPDEPPPPPPSY